MSSGREFASGGVRVRFVLIARAGWFVHIARAGWFVHITNTGFRI